MYGHPKKTEHRIMKCEIQNTETSKKQWKGKGIRRWCSRKKRRKWKQKSMHDSCENNRKYCAKYIFELYFSAKYIRLFSHITGHNCMKIFVNIVDSEYCFSKFNQHFKKICIVAT